MNSTELHKMRIVLYFLRTIFLGIEHNRIYASSIMRPQIDSCRLIVLVMAALPVEPDTPALAPTLGTAAAAVKKLGGDKNI